MKPTISVRRLVFQSSLFVVLTLALSHSAMATVETVKGSLTCFIGCSKSVVQEIAQGETHAFEVVGQFVDGSTGVEINGSGVDVSYGARKTGSNSSIVVNFDVDPGATLGERTVKMRYLVEASGPDTFKVKVVRKGTISQIRYRRQLPFRPGGGPATELVAPNNLPLNERVILIVTGTRLDGVQVRPETNYQSVRVLPGATATSATVEIEFTASGSGPLVFFDSSLSSQDMRSSGSSRFSYGGGNNRNVQYGGTPAPATFIQPVIGGGGGTPNLFVDVAPRANMLNVFRRNTNFAPVNRNGLTMVRIGDEFCSTLALNQNGAAVITVPNPVWGVSNVGTSDINTAFVSQLRTGAQVLDTETAPGLNPGETRDFTFQRQNSTVRVRRFSDLPGCFASPNDTGFFFEDPAFTVTVNTNAGITEAAARQGNNSRNY